MMTLGWKEWVALPDIGIKRIKAKVDTGARTSALHAFEVREFDQDGQKFVEFSIHPRQRDTDTVEVCRAAVVDERVVRDSGGHAETRYVIQTPLRLGDSSWPIEVTLTTRDDMLFRMLLGRTAINNRAVVNPAKKYLTGRPKK